MIPLLFHITMAGLEEETCKVQEGGVVLGRKKLWTVSYAGDVILLATNPEGLKQMIKRFKNIIRRRGLEINTDKSKIRIFRIEGRRKKEDKFMWEEKEIEIVKRFKCLGYLLN